MWARVKGRTENTLLKMPLKAVYLFRPAFVQPLHGVRTKTAWYGAVYVVMRSFYPVLKMLFPNYVTTTECVGHAMLKVTKQRFPNAVLENRDINVMCAKTMFPRSCAIDEAPKRKTKQVTPPSG
jgi:hypothetical protein